MKRQMPRTMSARVRLALCSTAGVGVGIALAIGGLGRYALLTGWDVAAALYVASVLVVVLRSDAGTTKAHALSENPGRAATDILLFAASLASLLAVGLLILRAHNLSGAARSLNIALGLVSVVVSWCVVHTLYMLRYARYYYGQPEGGVDFGRERPTYADFAYLAFTVGMTFQVSDTTVQSRVIRSAVLKHALVSYVFGAVIIAATINLLAGLSQ